ncbi:hypothetical protein GCM10008090_33240 [Arenicella chitinivorans]|uniref:Uncharacterized protein n=1 Tax=Arenicella chitinivorans TaxID=1329800 RepID=A0A918S2K7_9GAMM|nr:hypothetical protein [Arenicella chitinivorans]GHA20675.1 hypothetical protein GCM10008090_33240 [Arenicella chitinivorans]
MTYRNFVRRTAVIDFGLFVVLALPYVSIYVLGLLFSLGERLGDLRALPELSDPFVMLSINLIGVFGLFTVWLRGQGTLENVGPAIGVLKIFAAGLFAFSVFSGAPLILLVFTLTDAITGMRLLLKRN